MREFKHGVENMKDQLKAEIMKPLISTSLKALAVLSMLGGQLASAEVLQLQCTLPNNSQSTLTLDIPVDSNSVEPTTSVPVTGVLNDLDLRTSSGRQLPRMISLKGEILMSAKGPAFDLIEAVASSTSPLRLNVVGPATDLPSELIVDSETLPIVCR